MNQVIKTSSLVSQCRDKLEMDDIIYKSIHPEMYNDVIHHLRYNFFSDEPLNKSLHLCKPGRPHKELEEFSLSILNQRISFAAILESTGEVIGVILNGFETEDENSKPRRKLYNDEKLQKIFDFLGSVDKDIGILSRYNITDIMELKILSVDLKFRGRGIAGRLYELSEKYARSKGFQLLRADATALFSQKLFEKYGFMTLKEIIYDEYPSKEAPLFTVESPHVSFKLMVKILN